MTQAEIGTSPLSSEEDLRKEERMTQGQEGRDEVSAPHLFKLKIWF